MEKNLFAADVIREDFLSFHEKFHVNEVPPPQKKINQCGIASIFRTVLFLHIIINHYLLVIQVINLVL